MNVMLLSSKKWDCKLFFLRPQASESNLRLTAAADAFLTSSKNFHAAPIEIENRANDAGVLSFGDFTLGVVRRRSIWSSCNNGSSKSPQIQWEMLIISEHATRFQLYWHVWFQIQLEAKKTALIWLLDASVSLSFSVTVRRTFPWWK